jgi:hypothetical protein
MSENINYVRLIGVKAKEATLIESFLSIASEDGLIIEIDRDNKHKPTTIFVDELFHSDSLADDHQGAAIIILGDDHNYKSKDYLHRPLKWSAFQEMLDTFVVSRAEPKAHGLSITELTQLAESESDQEDQVMTESEYSMSEFSVSEFSVSQATSTNTGAQESQSQSEFSEVQTSFSEMGTVIEDDMEVVEMAHSRVIAERALFEGGGLVLGPNIVFWENFDCLMTVKSRPVLYILSSTGSVYSEYGYLDWGLLLKSKYARVYPLPKDWSAEEKLAKYPLSWLVWFSSISRSRGYLLKSIDKAGVFMINEWPAFDQVYNNNDHLRLCSLLSTAPYSLQDLAGKTRLKSKIIVGFLNACEKQGLLKTFSSVDDALDKQRHLLPPQAG